MRWLRSREAERSQVVAGTRDAVMMVESEAHELDEDTMLGAVLFGQQQFQPVIDLIIDLAQCPTIDAAGIVLLLEAHRRAMRYGGTLTLRSPSARLQRNLQLAKLDRVLHVLAPCPPEKQDDNERLVS